MPPRGISAHPGFLCLSRCMTISLRQWNRALALTLFAVAACAGSGQAPASVPPPETPADASSEVRAPGVDPASPDVAVRDGAPASDIAAPQPDASTPVARPDAAAADSAPTAARASAGCAAASIPTGVIRKTITVDGKMRTYLLSVPAGHRPGAPQPLVFAWHGLGGSGMLARFYFGVEQASQGAAVFVYPDALPQAAFNNSTGWNLAPESEDFHFF